MVVVLRMKKPLNIAIIVNKTREIPAWEHEMIRNLEKEDFVSDVIFVNTNEVPIVCNASFFYRLFTRFENWWFGSVNDAMKCIKLTDKLINEDTIHELKPDLIYISSTINENYQSTVNARLGIWRIVFGKNKYRKAVPPAFREVMNNESTTGSSLIVKLGNEELTVYNGTTITIPFSVKNNLNHLAWKSSSFLKYRIKELYELGDELFFKKYRSQNTIVKESQLIPPGNFQMIWLFGRNIFRYLIYKLRDKFNKKDFTIFISDKTYNNSIPDINGFKALTLVKGTFIADPFVVQHEAKQFIFFEEYIYAKAKAHISVMEFNTGGEATNPSVVLNKAYHLSYPFVFEWENIWYMIPETVANKTVELYRCKEFPHQWEFVMNLFENFSLIDSTLLYHENIWWLFAVTRNHSFTTPNDQLLLFYSGTLFSTEWKAHPQNPISTDISNCRPAGKIFLKDGKLFRPAQNNASQQYGYGVKINRIDVLNKIEYSETIIEEIDPAKNNRLAAVHTLNFTEEITVIDGIVK